MVFLLFPFVLLIVTVATICILREVMSNFLMGMFLLILLFHFIRGTIARFRRNSLAEGISFILLLLLVVVTFSSGGLVALPYLFLLLLLCCLGHNALDNITSR